MPKKQIENHINDFIKENDLLLDYDLTTIENIMNCKCDFKVVNVESLKRIFKAKEIEKRFLIEMLNKRG